MSIDQVRYIAITQGGWVLNTDTLLASNFFFRTISDSGWRADPAYVGDVLANAYVEAYRVV